MEVSYKFTVLLLIIVAFTDNVFARTSKKEERPIIKAREGDTIHLSCDRGNVTTDTLYAVKWYKDEKEFFRNYPKAENPVKVYEIDGFTLDTPLPSPWEVTLKNVNATASGKYTCMVVDYPRYRTIYKSTIVEVASKNETQSHPPDSPHGRSSATFATFSCVNTFSLSILVVVILVELI